MKSDLNLTAIIKNLHVTARKVGAYKAFLFFLALASLYGFIVWRINVLSSAPPSASDLSSASQSAAQPHIDQNTIDKIQNLQDNSVNVQSLFDQARQNPFQEE
jgi:hypothetical protein